MNKKIIVTLINSSLLLSCGGGNSASSSSTSSNSAVSSSVVSGSTGTDSTVSNPIGNTSHSSNSSNVNGANPKKDEVITPIPEPINDTPPHPVVPSLSTPSTGTAPQYDTKRYDVQERDENRKRDIAVMDTGFYHNSILTNRLEIKSSGWDVSHGTGVATLVAKHNTNSKIYGYYYIGKYNMFTYKEAHDQGLRIFNQSYGHNRSKPPYPTYTTSAHHINPFIKEYAKTDSIFTWAAGNGSNAQDKKIATPRALYPHIDDDARNGWIAVASIDYQPNCQSLTHPECGTNFLSSYSNKIGEEGKTWGIAAPGRWNQEGIGSGTSFATPVVTATVANVWNQFPWMSNHLVVVSVLSTANKPGTEIQTEEPDETFGWGILNNDRAIKGPGRFDTKLLTNRDRRTEKLLVVDFDERNYHDLGKLTWSNNIAGDAGIYKDGTGTLYLSGANTYTGDTVINKGKLVFNNTLLNSNVLIHPHGTFVAKNDKTPVNVTSSHFKNNGTLEVYGKGLKLTGNYTATENSKLQIDIHTATLKVKGTANFGNSKIVANIQNLEEVPTLTKNKKDIVTADKIENYNDIHEISSHISSYIKIDKLSHTNKKITIEYSRKNGEAVLGALRSATPMRVMAARNLDVALDKIANTPPSKHDVNLFNDDVPDPLSVVPEAASVMALRVLNSNADRITQNYDELSANIHPQTMQLQLKQSQHLRHKLANKIANLNNDNVFVQGVLGITKLSDASFAKTNAKTQGITLGLNFNKDKLSFGMVLKQANTEAKFSNNAGQNEIRSLGAYGFARYEFNRFYLSSLIGGSKFKNHVNRMLLGESVQTKYNSSMLEAQGELGTKFELKNATISPFVLTSVERLSVNGFDEKVPLSLKTQAKQFKNTQIGGGIRTNFDFDKLSLSTSLTHSVLLNPQNFGFGAQFNGSDTQSSVHGSNQSRQLSLLNLDISYHFSKQFKAFIGVEQSLQNIKNDTKSMNAGFSYHF